jgi:plastocyanin
MRRTTIAALIAPALLLLAGLAAPATQAGGGCHGAVSPPGDGESSVIKIDGCMFFPTIARVPVGTAVRFLNTGQVPHNVTGVAGTWASGDFASGAEYRHAFSAPGVYPFACTLHPGMNGAIVVGGDAPAPAAPAMTSTSAQIAATETAGVELLPLAVAGLAGLGIGAIGAGAIVTRRRRHID